jgi:FkbM family methyltransferase
VFEPSEKTYIVLKENVQSLDNVKVEKLAVWNKKGKFKLHYRPKNLSGSYSLREWNEDLGGEYAQTTTYLHIIESNKISEIDILKIDIESVELDVLFDIFTNCSDVPINNIFIEYHGEVVLNELKETFSVIYEIIHCNEVSKSQGSVLMTLK